jgi:hypothetical protein
MRYDFLAEPAADFFAEERSVLNGPEAASREQTTDRAADVTALRFTDADRTAVRIGRSFMIKSVPRRR